ncbi:hypothetical protein IHE45_02G084100 [Dioscorea alata]|uniref:Uncharacterized protein n=1 Tax=Dioscorea alata TaxID=55571 RepID=A0ACB7WS04_DIOAL|nr:hypothetical protein IHE45_02G084100 [Dioscorea alata]
MEGSERARPSSMLAISTPRRASSTRSSTPPTISSMTPSSSASSYTDDLQARSIELSPRVLHNFAT